MYTLKNQFIVFKSLDLQVRSLEAELKKQDAQEKNLKNGEDIKSTDSFLQVVRNLS